MGSIQKLTWILIITSFVVLGFIFSTQNAAPVSIEFMQWSSKPVPLAFTLFVAFGAGFLISYFSAIIQMLKLRLSAHKSQKLIENLEKEVRFLRNQPILEELTTTLTPKNTPDRTYPPQPLDLHEDYTTEDYN